MNADGSFGSIFPKTEKLLEESRGTVFPDYAIGVCADSKKWFSSSSRCTVTSLFDLASLTKVLATTTLSLIAENEGALKLDKPIQFFFPKFPSEKVTLSHLLNHSSGFPAHLDLHAKFHAPDGPGNFDGIKTPPRARFEYEQVILESWKESHFERECIYSDLGFMLLGWILEKILKCPLDAAFQEHISKPFKLQNLQFLPTSPDIVPTETCPWRGHTLVGEVHDDNAYVLGGVAGHAGLFGNVIDVLRLAEIWLNQEAPLSKPLVQKYWSLSHVAGASRVLGWDSVSSENSSAGHYFSVKSRGHLGFTGTSLWIDPEKKIIVSLLTNRVHPTRTNDRIKVFRPKFHDSLLTELGFAK